VLVLVVEDEGLINLTAVEELRRAGFDVMSAYNADEAIALLEAHSEIRLVFTDIDMPGSMDGLNLAAAVRERWPPVRIIVTSGKRVPEALPDGAVFIAKPYSTATIVETISGFG
jgi:two-component system, response regulator PdtaR